MNNALIKTTQTTIGNETIQTVNARELHEFLGVGKYFANWIKDRIKKYDFIESRDFTVHKIMNGENTVAKFGNGKNGQFTAIEYHISIDMAKELSMVENNEQGRKARQYFIEVEKQYKNTVITAESIVAAMTPLIREAEQMKAKFEFAKNFLPKGKAGDVSESNGLPKNKFRRGFYCSKNGKDTSVLLEHPSLPGLFEEYKQIK